MRFSNGFLLFSFFFVFGVLIFVQYCIYSSCQNNIQDGRQENIHNRLLNQLKMILANKHFTVYSTNSTSTVHVSLLQYSSRTIFGPTGCSRTKLTKGTILLSMILLLLKTFTYIKNKPFLNYGKK